MIERWMPKSLASRMLAISIAWTVIALLATGFVIAALFQANIERNFDDLLEAHLYNLMSAVDIDTSGKLVGEPDLGDPRFLQPLSGWHWTVAKADEPDSLLLASQSLDGSTYSAPSQNEIGFSDEFRRVYRWSQRPGSQLKRVEALLFVGESEQLYRLSVAGNMRGLQEAIASFNRRLIFYFLLFGIVSLAATYAVTRLGLLPLNRARNQLERVRNGSQQTLSGPFPTEIAPLAAEINALIEANEEVVERARLQVGNLAHGLKTPLAVIANESRTVDDGSGRLIGEQVNAMRNQVDTYLNRARVSAQRGSSRAMADTEQVIERLERVMAKLNPSIDYEVAAAGAPHFRGEQQDLEEVLGNLLENASRFASSTVRITAAKISDKEHKRSLRLIVEDDGPGIDEDQLAAVLKRGKRLDESEPGSGLGLSIVNDIVTEYGGELDLARSSLGGLGVTVLLPSH